MLPSYAHIFLYAYEVAPQVVYGATALLIVALAWLIYADRR
jgi:hypothetical protein